MWKLIPFLLVLGLAPAFADDEVRLNPEEGTKETLRDGKVVKVEKLSPDEISSVKADEQGWRHRYYGWGYRRAYWGGGWGYGYRRAYWGGYGYRPYWGYGYGGWGGYGYNYGWGGYGYGGDCCCY